MKRKVLLSTILVLIFAMSIGLLAACGEGTMGKIENVDFTVSYDLGGGVGEFPSQKVKYGDDLTLPTTEPTKDGYVFDGWEIAAGGKLTTDVKVVAKWLTEAEYDLIAILKPDVPIPDSPRPRYQTKDFTVFFDFNDGDGAGQGHTHASTVVGAGHTAAHEFETKKVTAQSYVMLSGTPPLSPGDPYTLVMTQGPWTLDISEDPTVATDGICIPTRAGYTFTGWAFGNHVGTPVLTTATDVYTATLAYGISEPIGFIPGAINGTVHYNVPATSASFPRAPIFYAQWEENDPYATYSVEYHWNYGNIANDDSLFVPVTAAASGANFLSPIYANPTQGYKLGYMLSGWTSLPNTAPIVLPANGLAPGATATAALDAADGTTDGTIVLYALWDIVYPEGKPVIIEYMYNYEDGSVTDNVWYTTQVSYSSGISTESIGALLTYPGYPTSSYSPPHIPGTVGILSSVWTTQPYSAGSIVNPIDVWNFSVDTYASKGTTAYYDSVYGIPVVRLWCYFVRASVPHEKYDLKFMWNYGNGSGTQDLYTIQSENIGLPVNSMSPFAPVYPTPVSGLVAGTVGGQTPVWTTQPYPNSAIVNPAHVFDLTTDPVYSGLVLYAYWERDKIPPTKETRVQFMWNYGDGTANTYHIQVETIGAAINAATPFAPVYPVSTVGLIPGTVSGQNHIWTIVPYGVGVSVNPSDIWDLNSDPVTMNLKLFAYWEKEGFEIIGDTRTTGYDYALTGEAVAVTLILSDDINICGTGTWWVGTVLDGTATIYTAGGTLAVLTPGHSHCVWLSSNLGETVYMDFVRSGVNPAKVYLRLLGYNAAFIDAADYANEIATTALAGYNASLVPGSTPVQLNDLEITICDFDTSVFNGAVTNTIFSGTYAQYLAAVAGGTLGLTTTSYNVSVTSPLYTGASYIFVADIR